MDERHDRGSYRRHLAAIGFVAAGALLMSTGTAHADPSPDDVRDKIEQFEKDYSKLAEKYNQAKEDHDAAKEKLSDVKSDEKDSKKDLKKLKGKVSKLANAAYSGADYSSPAYLMRSNGPKDALEQAADLGYLSKSQEATLDKYNKQQEKLDSLKSKAEKTEKKSEKKLSEAKSAKKKSKKKLDKQKNILDEVTEDESSSSGGGGGSYTGSATGNAKKALDFVYAQIGDSYSMGADGPDTWDCSSLVQHAWKQGGVNLPRTTSQQVNAGKTVSWGEKQPGDLIFFYDGPSHVGMYVGDNKMVHASNPSKPVEEVSLSGYYEQNKNSVVRP